MQNSRARRAALFLVLAGVLCLVDRDARAQHGESPTPVGPLPAWSGALQAHGAERPRQGKPVGDQPTAERAGIVRPATQASPAFDATYYHLDLGVHFEPNRVDGRTRVVGRAEGRSIDSLRLDLRSANVTVDSVRAYSGPAVGASIRRGTAGSDRSRPSSEGLPFHHEDDVLTIALPEGGTAAGGRIDVEIFYRAFPLGSFPGFVDPLTFDQTQEEGRPVAWTLSEPYGARTWWPGKDHPSDKADSARVTVTVPERMQVASNGVLEGTETENGRTTYRWFSRYPIAPYLLSFAAGEYEVSEQTYVRPDSLAEKWGDETFPIVHYTYPDRSFRTGFERVLGMMPLMEYWFGPYPFPEEKYGHAQFTWGGGMEHQTISSMGGASRALVAHELAHMWYGDAITLRHWPHLWLNEGFATYGELIFWEAREDEFPGQYERVYDLYWRRAQGAEGTLIVEDTSSVGNLFDTRRVYAKGAMVLQMLRHVVGTETFRTILRSYAQDPELRYGTALSRDFRAVAESVSERDLGWFFDQWLRRPGHPAYELAWHERRTASGYEVELQIDQTQAQAPFRMPVDLAFDLLETGSGSSPDTVTARRRVWTDERTDRITVELPGRPTSVRLDPDRQILRDPEVPVRRTDEQFTPVPDELALSDPYPQPTSGSATTEIRLPTAGRIVLQLFDAAGRLVRTPHEGPLDAGVHRIPVRLRGLPAGTYFLRLTAPTETRTASVVHLP